MFIKTHIVIAALAFSSVSLAQEQRVQRTEQTKSFVSGVLLGCLNGALPIEPKLGDTHKRKIEKSIRGCFAILQSAATTFSSTEEDLATLLRDVAPVIQRLRFEAQQLDEKAGV